MAGTLLAMGAVGTARAADFRVLPGFRPGSATVVDFDQLRAQSGRYRRLTTWGVLRDPLPGPHGAAVVGVDTDLYDCQGARFWPSALVLYDAAFRQIAASPPGRRWVPMDQYAGAEVGYFRLTCTFDPAMMRQARKVGAPTWQAAVTRARRMIPAASLEVAANPR